MAGTGLPMPPDPTGQAQPSAPTSVGGIMNVGGLSTMPDPMAEFESELKAATSGIENADGIQSAPIVHGLAGKIRDAFNQSKAARMVTEQEMVEALLARRGEYTAEKLAQIQESRQPIIYMMIASGKMRQVESLLRDALLGSGTEKPWTIDPTPSPELPPEISEMLVNQLTMEIEMALASGFPPTIDAAQQRLRELRAEIDPLLMEKAREMADRMENKMEDQLIEGGYLHALDHFITDLATYKTAFLAGPIVRRKPKLSWTPTGEMVVETVDQLEWERVDPFDVFPAPWARNINDGPLIRRHRLSREALSSLIGVEGFDEASIRKVLATFGDSGHKEWSTSDASKEVAEGKTTSAAQNSDLIDTLQFWGMASGKMLVDWGLPKASVPDLQKEYHIEAWMVDNIVVKAMLNADPLARRPLYACSFQAVPGSVWGNSVYDLMKDCQDMCNGAARSLAANMGISSGPQVSVITTRLAAGEDITEMYPWKIWQFESSALGTTHEKPLEFFQPQSNAVELMGVYEKFSNLADEYTGIPKYMSGFNGGEGGAGRTASGISMMISNASKIIKQVIGGIDYNILTPMLERLYYYNMRYGQDADLKGDVKIVARGASSLVAKESARVRNNEFLQVALTSPIAQQIMGIEGVAEVLRGTVKSLDHNPDKVVPPLPVLRMRMAQQQQIAMEQQAAMAAQGGENLEDGTPTTDNYSPKEKKNAAQGPQR